MADLLPPLRPIAIKERLSILYIEKGQLDVLDGAFVVVDKTGTRAHIPVSCMNGKIASVATSNGSVCASMLTAFIV